MQVHVTMIQLQSKIMVYVNTPAEGFDCAGNCISGDLITFALSESYGDGGVGFLSLNGDTIINGVPYAGGSGNPSSVMADACADLSACNTVSFESTDSYVSELSWTVTSGDDILA